MVAVLLSKSRGSGYYYKTTPIYPNDGIDDNDIYVVIEKRVKAMIKIRLQTRIIVDDDTETVRQMLIEQYKIPDRYELLAITVLDETTEILFVCGDDDDE